MRIDWRNLVDYRAETKPGRRRSQEQIGEAVASRCGDALEKIPADVSAFDLSSLNATADTWRYGRGYSCLLVVPGGGTTTGDALISPGA